MKLSDLVLLFFILTAFLLRGKDHWKRAFLYVMGGIMIGDFAGAIVMVSFHHFYPAVLGVVRHFMTFGALIGGICDWVIPAPSKSAAQGRSDETAK